MDVSADNASLVHTFSVRVYEHDGQASKLLSRPVNE